MSNNLPPPRAPAPAAPGGYLGRLWLLRGRLRFHPSVSAGAAATEGTGFQPWLAAARQERFKN